MMMKMKMSWEAWRGLLLCSSGLGRVCRSKGFEEEKEQVRAGGGGGGGSGEHHRWKTFVTRGLVSARIDSILICVLPLLCLLCATGRK